MLVSLKCIRQYVSLDGLSSKQIADGLTFAGVEVEEIRKIASGTNLVIGEVLACENHPDSDHLHVLNVNLGDKYGVKQIVCGAPNARKGLKVIVAREGSQLPGGEIKKSVIRGVESNGMCCSLLELGVDAKYLNEYQTKGIEELPLDAPVGEENVLGYLGLDDEVLDLSVLANRPDLLSVFNVAKEIGAIFKRSVKIPSFEGKVNFKTDLVVGSETDKCKQFAGKEIKGITIKESPTWLKGYLNAMGVRSINNIVDIGNFVMLLTGQPLHMYDADKLAKKELIAKDNYEGAFVALDDKSYDVIKNDIVITTNNKPMCLGGVMGSKECEVDTNTKNIFIESASFDGVAIRHTSNRLGLASESSSRFVKGTYHFQYEQVINFTSSLIEELCEAKDFSNIVSYLAEEYKEIVISSSKDSINNRLGTEFSSDEIVDVLTRLNFKVNKLDNDKYDVTVPCYRLDVTCNADLSEEVIRILGFSHVKSVLPTLDTTIGVLSQKQQRKRNIRNYLLAAGLDECLTYTLLDKVAAEKLNILHNEDKYVVLNPLTDEHEVVRSHIIHSLVSAASYNVSRQNKDLALFEVSNVMTKVSRCEHLAVVLVGNRHLQGNLNVTPYNFYSIKGIVDGIFTLLGIEESRYKYVRSACKELHPGKSADILFQNQVIGRCGELHPTLLKDYDLGKSNVIVLEMNIEPLLDAKVSEIKVAPISKFPTISHDLALIVDKEVSAAELIKAIKFTGKGLVRDASIFDVYEGEHVEEGKKSIAISITYGSDHTLQDKEVSDVEDRIKFELFKAYRAELRS